jgi:hypothetical protein
VKSDSRRCPQLAARYAEADARYEEGQRGRNAPKNASEAAPVASALELRRFTRGRARGTPYAAISVERKVELMERHYEGIAVLLFIGILLIFGGLFSDALGQLGGVLVIVSSIALLLGVIGQRRGARR